MKTLLVAIVLSAITFSPALGGHLFKKHHCAKKHHFLKKPFAKKHCYPKKHLGLFKYKCKLLGKHHCGNPCPPAPCPPVEPPCCQPPVEPPCAQPPVYQPPSGEYQVLGPHSDYASAPASSYSSAMGEVNVERAKRGLYPLAEDQQLSQLAWQKASRQARAGYMHHPGGTMGNARAEGVGMGNQFTTCYLNTTAHRVAGAATVTGRDGQRYHALLVR